MMRMIRTLPLLGLLGACGIGDPTLLYPVPDAPVAASRVSIAYRSVEIREVSLPSYAASDEIAFETDAGALESSGKALWADAPSRAITLELSRALLQITGAQIAPEPWPFEAFPDARIEVRVEQLLAGADGQLRLSGQYFVANVLDRPERTRLFSLSVPVPPEGGASGFATARGEAVAALARQIATDGLR